MTDTNGKSEPQVYNQFICIMSHDEYVYGLVYYFHEDDPIRLIGNFVMVVDRQGFPVGVTAVEVS